ncbi:Gfo/Idh/MocA family oxidoreductase [Vagococcus sp. BWB3-3]|uniref:Gfo/Idh/MocA family oxidoreductase n=1 Tax=Vagococcus allomyrinae TaxID=2794353 RepID=A0A940P168_9ENTE|nr:Gfo/Idh/MocA family oxidoreductase [Vagococcus allomyrinae]MBP1039574.1 Gfo/Idh/MocA family oxidoreductase [Vagococcus allomyrinae]
MKKLNVGVIGVGSIANEHIQAYLKNDNVNLMAFCDIDEEQLKKMGEQYGVKNLYTSKEEMLKDSAIEAVSVCTWNAAHAECTVAALNAGKHVLCEKPMATSKEDAEKMLAAAISNDRLLMIGFVRRFGNDTKILQDFVNSDFFGDLYFAKAQYLRRHGNPGGWFGDQSRSGGGPLIDLGVHVIDLVHYLLGQPKVSSVYGATFRKLESRKFLKDETDYSSVSKSDHDIFDVEDLATAMIRFDNGAVLSIDASFNLNLKDDVGKIELFGTKGGACLNPEIELFTDMNGYLTDINFKRQTSLDMNGLFQNEINHYVDVLLNQTTCLAPAEDGLAIMKILDGIYESARTGHEVIF